MNPRGPAKVYESFGQTRLTRWTTPQKEMAASRTCLVVEVSAYSEAVMPCTTEAVKRKMVVMTSDCSSCAGNDGVIAVLVSDLDCPPPLLKLQHQSSPPISCPLWLQLRPVQLRMLFYHNSIVDYGPLISAAHAFLYEHSAPLTICGVCSALSSEDLAGASRNVREATVRAKTGVVRGVSMWTCSRVLLPIYAARLK